MNTRIEKPRHVPVYVFNALAAAAGVLIDTHQLAEWPTAAGMTGTVDP